MYRWICLSIPHCLFGILFEPSLKRITKTFTIFTVFFAIALIAISQWTFAQDGSISDSAKENYTLLAAKPGYESMPALDVTEISNTIPTGALSISMNQDPQLEYRPSQSKRVLSWETGEGKSYFIPALEILGFIFAVNAFDRLAYSNQVEDGKKVYSSNFYTFWDNLVHGHWRYDKDAFHVNQFQHPYQGSIYHGFARSAGLNFWESLGYTFLGSFLWETGGETTHPSINDQVASGIAGSLYGEVLFRMASLLLESGGGEPGFWRELGAAILSPPTGFNRLVFGDRFKPIFPSRDPAVFQWVRLGVGSIVSDRTGSSINRNHQESLSYSMAYGLPGKSNYSYTRPFDYFQVEIGAASRANGFENITTRGLLLGKKYEVGDSYRGIWGLYGSFDYLSPRFFRVSSTAASFGTTAQWWLSPTVALQGTVLGGIGLGAGGKATSLSDRDYHYGLTERAVLALRLILGDAAMFRVTGRGYYISSLGGSKPKGAEAISHLEAGLYFRIYGHHALGIQYTTFYRAGHYFAQSNVHQSQGTLSLVYALLSDTRFGAVEWRNGHAP
jgi:hypothetical protein